MKNDENLSDLRDLAISIRKFQNESKRYIDLKDHLSEINFKLSEAIESQMTDQKYSFDHQSDLDYIKLVDFDIFMKKITELSREDLINKVKNVIELYSRIRPEDKGLIEGYKELMIDLINN